MPSVSPSSSAAMADAAKAISTGDHVRIENLADLCAKAEVGVPDNGRAEPR